MARRRHGETIRRPAETRRGGGRARPIDVGVADKNPLVLAGLKQLLAEDVRFNLVVTASDGERFLEAVARVPFEVGIIGWVMPFGGGRKVLDALRGRPDAPRIIVYTGAHDPEVPREVMLHGGAAFCSKSDPPEKLLDIIAAVAEGRMVFPFMDVRTLADSPLATLTRRERELLAALVTGHTNAQIARDYGLSVNTVKFHLKNLYGKLAVRNRAQAVALYLSSRSDWPYPFG